MTQSAIRVKSLVDEVDLGSQQHARGIEQISCAVLQMEQVTQRTASGAEQSASAGAELDGHDIYHAGSRARDAQDWEGE